MASEQDPARTVQFTSVPSLFEEVDDEADEGRDSLTFTRVSPDDFTEIERERQKRRRKFRFRRYDIESQILTIAIPTALHESLHGELYTSYIYQLVRRGRGMSWKSKRATWYSVQGPSGRKGKEGDSVGGPRPERGR
ncbi:hypothetical protein GE09DRAFT_1260386 [Coniochaeta sp. 2T2.1]|nr:hypothetical protein GE09DRAFT_1260386 [Coniochaeta sp. 2T2.1]